MGEIKIELGKLFATFVESLLNLKKPLYVYVRGFAVGMMATILTLADFVYCTSNSFFYTPFMSSNQNPEGLSTIRFAEIMGLRKANEMLYLEKKLTAIEAE